MSELGFKMKRLLKNIINFNQVSTLNRSKDRIEQNRIVQPPNRFQKVEPEPNQTI